MKPRIVKTHLFQIDNFLPLKPVQVGLDRDGSVAQILSQSFECAVELIERRRERQKSAQLFVREACALQISPRSAHLINGFSRLGNIVASSSLRVRVDHAVESVTQST